MTKHHGVLLDHARAQLCSIQGAGTLGSELQKAIRVAKGFQCTHEFAKLAASASFLPAKKLLAMSKHSRPPAVPMFIEWPARARHDGIIEAGHRLVTHDNMPDFAGFLIVQGPRDDLFDAYLFTSEEQPAGSVSVLPVGYRWRISDDHIELADADKYLNDQIYTKWATSFFFTTPYVTENDTDLIAELSHNVKAKWAPFLGHEIRKVMSKALAGDVIERNGETVRINISDDGAWARALRMVGDEQGGDARWLFAILGLLNLFKTQVSDPRTAGTGRFLFNRKPVKYSEFSTIDILVPGVSRIDYVSRHLLSAAKKRDHAVRPFYRWYRRDLIADDCGPLNHAMQPIPGFREFERCDVCGIRRTHVREHRRGDAALGTVQQSYVVDRGFAEITL